MNIISTSHLVKGQPLTINSHSITATHYRVEFSGAGWVRFVVLPGGSFVIAGEPGVVNVYIEDQVPGGIAAA